MPDDSLICVDYDSKVTAKVNSYLRIHRPDGVVILAQDDGSVQLRPRDVPGNHQVVGTGVGQPFAEGDDTGDGAPSSPRQSLTTPEQDNSLGVFQFQLFSGDMMVL
jgi:hypothetical protein